MGVTTRGERELALRFDTFPVRAHKKLEERIGALTQTLEERIQAATPYLTGRLRSEITPNLYADSDTRVAGYVSVVGSGGDYAKAATLEYGTDKPRRERERSAGILARLAGGKTRFTGRISRPVHMQALRYLRAPFEAMRPEIEAGLDEAMAEVITEEGAAS